VASTIELISLEIRHEYVFGYVPSGNRSDGKFHKVRVKVEPSPGRAFKVSNPAGYYAAGR
jgi:Ca-activated chloride channel homolog